MSFIDLAKKSSEFERMNKNSNLLIRATFAFTGIKDAFKKESSIRIQFLALGLLMALCFFLKPPLFWCSIFLAMSCLVICLELVNSAIEALLDKLYPEYDPTVKFIKDCLAGAVLMASFGSVFVFIFYLLSR